MHSVFSVFSVHYRFLPKKKFSQFRSHVSFGFLYSIQFPARKHFLTLSTHFEYLRISPNGLFWPDDNLDKIQIEKDARGRTQKDRATETGPMYECPNECVRSIEIE